MLEKEYGGYEIANQYRVFYLTPGRIPPPGSTGIALADGGIVWNGESGTFPDIADLGTHFDSDPTFDTTFTHSLATQGEIDEYNATISG